MTLELLSVFLSSFIAGSFFPMASEVLIITLQSQGSHWLPLLIAASIGNTLGGMTCYFIGLYGGKKLIVKLLSIKEEKLEIWSARSKGAEWIAIAAWLPFIGEVIAAALGIVSKRWKTVLFYMFLGKFLRYLFILKLGEFFS